VDILDEFADLEGPGEIAERYSVGCEASLEERRRVSWELHNSGEMVGSGPGRIEVQPREHLEEASGQHNMKNIWDLRKRTSSSIVVVKAKRYSSIVRWKISRSLTLIGTVMI